MIRYNFSNIKEQSLDDIRRICQGMVTSENLRNGTFKNVNYVWEFGEKIANHIRLLSGGFPLSLFDITCVVNSTIPVDQVRLYIRNTITSPINDKDKSSIYPSAMKMMNLDASSFYPKFMAANEMVGIKKLNIKRRRTFLIKKVIFNDPATIIYWIDGTKTVVKAEGEAFDPEKGLAMAIAKKYFGNEGNYYDVFRKWLPKEEKASYVTPEINKKPRYMSVKEYAAFAGVSESTIRTQLRKGQYPHAEKVNGKWQIPYNTDKPEVVDYE